MKSHFHFIPENRIQGHLQERFILCEDGVRWAVTGDFPDLARDHCCATMFTNYLIYLEGRGLYHGSARGDLRSLFRTVHSVIGNGPVLNIRGKSRRLFGRNHIPASAVPVNHLRSRRGIDQERNLSSTEIMYRRIRGEILQGSPVALLVAAAPLDWHWVLAMGFAEFEYGRHGLLILDNWHRDGFQIYLPDEGCRVISATALITAADNP